MSAVPPTIPGSGLYSSLQIYNANFNNVTVVNPVTIWKGYVNAATTTDVSLSGYQTIDTFATTEGSLVLVKDQSTDRVINGTLVSSGVQNGIYVVSNSDWTRSPDLIDGSSAIGIGMIVTDGSVNLNRIYVCTNTEESVIVGVSSLTFGTSVNESTPAGTNGQLQYLLNNTLTADTSLTSGSGKYTMSSLAVSGQVVTSSIKGTEYQINNKIGSGIYIDSGNIVIDKDSVPQLTVKTDKIINELPTLYAGSGSGLNYSFGSDASTGMSTNGGNFQLNNGSDYLSFQGTGIYTNVPTVSTDLQFNTSNSVSLSSNKILLNVDSTTYLTLDPNTTGSNYTNVNLTAPGYNINSGTGINYSTIGSITTTANGTQTMQLTQTGTTFNISPVAPSYLLTNDLVSRTGLVSESNDINVRVNEVSKLNIDSTALTASVPINAPGYLFYGDTDTGVTSTSGSLVFSTNGTALMQLNNNSVSTGYDLVVPQGAVSSLSLSTTQDTTSGLFSGNQTIDIVTNQVDLMTVSSTTIITNTPIIATDLSSQALNCYQVQNLGPTVPALSLSSGVYNYEGTIQPVNFTLAYLVVAGGGSGSDGGGGGGAGGVISSQSISTYKGAYLYITVGNGGVPIGGTGSNGSNSSLSGTGLTTVTAIGGGGGGPYNGVGSSGGSGGGGGYTGSNLGGSGTIGQGFSGGDSFSGSSSGGGGGAGAAGSNGVSGIGGNGGIGISNNITGSSVTYAGGGGGYSTGTSGTGGSGIGGNGSTSGLGGSGATNTGSGGGGGAGSGLGGSGIVILRMPTTAYIGSVINGGSLGTDYTVATVSTDTVVSFKTVGTYTFMTLPNYCDFLNLDQSTNYILNGSTGKGSTSSTSFLYFVYRNIGTAVGTIINGSGSTAASLNISNNILQLADSSTDNYYSLNAVINSNRLLNNYTTFTLTYLVVGGGGGGGAAFGGGGGAGGVLSGSQLIPQFGILTCVLGSGGSGGSSISTGLSGSNSTLTSNWFGTIISTGGGGGGSGGSGGIYKTGLNGGSGGGGGGFGTSGSSPGGTGTSGQGFDGGTGSNNCGGGGGGASEVGTGGVFVNPGNGGNGISNSITGTSLPYGGGGGAGYTGSSSGTGGSGGGGAGGTTNGNPGTVNTGSGGGGSGSGSTNGGAGGSGVVIIRFPTVYYIPANLVGTATVTTVSTDTVIKFTSGSGSYTF